MESSSITPSDLPKSYHKSSDFNALSSTASTVSSSLESEQTGIDAVVDSQSEFHLDPIMTLPDLECELVRVLEDVTDSERIPKAKRVLERYRGSDWMEYRRLPDPHSTSANNYERAPVAKKAGLFDLLLLSWGPQSASPIHSHPCERCYLMAISGTMFENRYRQEDGPLKLVHSMPIPLGVATWISDEVGLHSVGNRGEDVSCSLHCYIPGFTTPCTIYKEDGSSVQAVFTECTTTSN